METERDNNVVHISHFKAQKIEQEGLVRGRTPLYLSYQNSHVAGSKEASKLCNFSDRISAIKANLSQVSELLDLVKKLKDSQALNLLSSKQS